MTSDLSPQNSASTSSLIDSVPKEVSKYTLENNNITLGSAEMVTGSGRSTVLSQYSHSTAIIKSKKFEHYFDFMNESQKVT